MIDSFNKYQCFQSAKHYDRYKEFGGSHARCGSGPHATCTEH